MQSVRYRFIFIVLLLFLLVRGLFVSPRSPSHPLSKNALLSFFLHSIILLSFPSPSTAPSASRVHSICGMTTSTVFSRNVPLSSILAAAMWSSSTVYFFLFTGCTVFFQFGVFVGSGGCCGCSGLIVSCLVVVSLSYFRFQLEVWATRSFTSLHVFKSSVLHW